jgi:ATP-dependent helicase HepA
MSDYLSFDPYFVFIATAHALRRKAEAAARAMGATYGVAADPLPFQLATVRHVLTDVRIRHLIADEVGLGKTIQAIMILNALHRHDPEHRAVIVAPERLLAQWHEELWTRGHILGHVVDEEDNARMRRHLERRAEAEAGEAPPPSPEDDPIARFSEARVMLLRPRDVADQSEWLDPLRHRMLIIDEPQSIPRAVLSKLQTAANENRTDDPAFRQLLILSATPRLGDPGWRDLIFDLLEPERMRLARDAGEDPIAWFEARERSAAIDLVGRPLDELEAAGEVAFRTKARTRRISRQTRADWGEYFPHRENMVRHFIPTASECGRLDLIESLIESLLRGKAAAAASSLDGQPWTSIRGLLRSRRSAREAIDQLDRLTASAAAVRQDAVSDFGDSRLDELLDVLSDIFGAERERPSRGEQVRKREMPEKVVIVAGDAGTIDMLLTVLPRYFPELAGGAITSLRRLTAASDSSFEDIRAMHEALTPFIDGDARVLLLGDWIQAGLNLQHSARNMIFYSLPWDPQSVDQLIGRIDRLSRSSIGAVRAGHTRAGKIRLWRLVMRNSPEEDLSEAMDALGVFEHPLPQASEESWAEINRLIVALVTKKGDDRAQALARLEEIGATWKGRGFDSLLDHFNPHTKARSLKNIESIGEIASLAAIPGEQDLPVVDWIEAANRDWLHATGKTGGFTFAENHRDFSPARRRFDSLWYASRQTTPPFHLQEIKQGNERDDKVPLLLSRRHMTVPPSARVKVSEGDTSERPLHFFDHGAAIHDELLKRWLEFGARRFASVPRVETLIKVGPDHPGLALEGRPVLVSVSMGNPISEEAIAIPDTLAMSAAGLSAAAWEDCVAQHREGVEADRRWLSDLFPARFMFRVSTLGDHGWESVKQDVATTLLRARPNREDKTRVQSSEVRLKTSVASQCDRQVAEMKTEFKDYCDTALRILPKAWKRRHEAIKQDATDLAEVFRNRAETRARQVAGAAMAALQRGQVEADRRREALALARADARTKAAYALMTGTMKAQLGVTLHACLRFVRSDVF